MYFNADTGKWEDSPYTVETAFSLLRGLGLVKLHEPGSLQSRDLVLDAKVSPQSRRRLETLFVEALDCPSSLRFMRNANREAMKVGIEKFLCSRFSDSWEACNRFNESDVQAFMEHATHPRREMDDFCTQPYSYKINFNNSWGIQSSNYWVEYAANRIEKFECNYMWASCSDYATTSKLIRLLRHVAHTDMPKLIYPLYYDFLCGKKMRIARKLNLCFVAKYLDCSAEGLRKVARHYVENCLQFDQSIESAVVDYDSVRVGNICFDTRSMEELHKACGGVLYDIGRRYYPKDIDAACNITRVIFDVDFEMEVQLNEPPEPGRDLERYRYGVRLDESYLEALQAARDFFEHPGELLIDNDWALLNPTLETFREYKRHRFFARDFDVDCVARLFLSRDEICESLYAAALRKKDNAHGDIKYGNFSLWHSCECFGSTDTALELEEKIRSYTYYGAILNALLENWDLVKTPKRMLRLIESRVPLDPLSYTESSDESIRAYARTLV